MRLSMQPIVLHYEAQAGSASHFVTTAVSQLTVACPGRSTSIVVHPVRVLLEFALCV
jgi:hypothetical protein